MSDNSLKLQKQWRNRTEDECFKDVKSLHEYNLQKQQITRQQTVNLGEVRINTDDGDLFMEANNKNLLISNYAFGKIAQTVGASTEYLRKLSPELVCDNLNYGLANIASGSKNKENLMPWEIDESGRIVDTNAKLIYENNTSNRLVNIAGQNYPLVFDAVLSDMALKLQDKYGLFPAAETKGLGGAEHHGLYSSPRDCFIFLSTSDRPVLEFAKNPIYKGIMMWNGFEETFGMSLFWFSGICCNYSIHQFTEKFSFNMKHSSKFFERFKANEALKKFELAFDGSTQEEKDWLNKATNKVLGFNEEEVTDQLLRLRLPLLGKRNAQRVYEMSVDREDTYGTPCSVWSLGNCITEIARDIPVAAIKRDYMQTAKRVFDLV